MKKNKCLSATLKKTNVSFSTLPVKTSIENFIINEEDDNFSHDDLGVVMIKENNTGSAYSRINRSENVIRAKKFGRSMNLKLDISKKKDNLFTKEMVGIKKEKKYYYFRIKNDEKYYFKGKNWVMNCNDDLKVKINKENGSAEIKKTRKSQDDLDFFKVIVKFLQKP